MRRLTLAAACALAMAFPAGATAANDPLRGAQWNLSMIESDAAHVTSTGRGALVAIIDTGVKPSHPDLAGGRVLAGYDFVDNDSLAQDTVDGHGTHVAGIIGATENNAVGVASVAPGVRLLPIRVLSNDGSGLVSDVVKGIDHAVARGAQVINLSLGGDPIIGYSAAFNAAIDRALDAGRVVVGAAGNDYLPICSQPSGQGRLLCVGSVDLDGQKSSFSNFGLGLGLVAPGGSGLGGGEDVLSTFIGPDYQEIAGTSQAAPHVAGVAALLMAKGLTAQQTTKRILATAKDLWLPGPDILFGAGIVNARAAVAGLPPDPTDPPPPLTVGSAARISMRTRDRIRNILRRGIRVRCRPSGAGRCRVRATRRARSLAYGSRRVTLGRSTLVVARLNRGGHATLRRALRARRPISLRVRVTLPGISPQLRTLRLRP